jgi:hypothetical protein
VLWRWVEAAAANAAVSFQPLVTRNTRTVMRKTMTTTKKTTMRRCRMKLAVVVVMKMKAWAWVARLLFL